MAHTSVLYFDIVSYKISSRRLIIAVNVSTLLSIGRIGSYIGRSYLAILREKKRFSLDILIKKARARVKKCRIRNAST